MYLEALKSKHKEVFEKLRKFPEFYLAGGTALALQIGHRISIDFDLFSKKDITPNLLRKVKRVFKEAKIELLLRHSEQLSVKANGVRMDFVQYRFPLILRPIEFGGVKLLQAAEIAAMKAYALNYRGTLKDYIDLYFILKDKHSTLGQIKKIAEKKYKEEFNFRLLLEQLIYLTDIKKEERKEIEFLKEEVDEEELKRFFAKETAKIKL